MISDAIINASSLPALSKEKDLSSKKKKTSRYAKLKRSKIDVRREQWLSQGKGKNDKDSDGIVESPPPRVGEGNVNYGLGENLQKRAKEDERNTIILSMHESESESLMSSSFGSSVGLGCSGKNFSSSSGSGCWSGSVSEEERDYDYLDDWEAIADALTSESNQEQNLKTESLDPGNKNSVTSTLTEASVGLAHCSNTNNRAWRPDDTSRPRSLPNPSKQQQQQQHNRSAHSGGNHIFKGEGIRSWRSLASQPCSCPICCEDFDSTDSSFLPCPCGFRLCLFCHKRILEEDSRCPGCRRQYESVSSDAAFGDGAPTCYATFAAIVKIRV